MVARDAAVMRAEPVSQNSDEQKVIDRALDGDVAAFEKLYRKHIGRIYGLCLRMTGSPAAADDCAQEAFIKAWNNLGKFRGQSAFGTWVYRIAVNQVLATRRSEQRRGVHLELIEGRDSDESRQTTRPMTDQEIDIELAVKTLPDGARDVFVLHSVYGYSHEETANMLGVAVGTSKAQLHRARRLLMQQLEK